MLVLKMLRNIKQSLGRVISIVALILMGVMFYTGMNGVITNLERVGVEYFKTNNLADAWVYGENIQWQDIKKIQKIPGVTLVQAGIVRDFSMKQYDDATLRLHAQDDFEINKPLIIEGSELNKSNSRQIALAKSFADVYGIKVGDDFHIEISGERINFKVAALVRAPEYVYPIKGSDEMIPDPKKFAFGYCSSEAIWRKVYPNGKAYNSLCLNFSEGVDSDNIKSEVENVLHFRMSSFLPRKDSIVGAMFESEIKNSKSIMGAIPIIFFMVAALVTLTTLARMVETERTEIGIIKALGYSNESVLAYYVSFALIVALMGSALGVGMGILIPESMMKLYDQYFELPKYSVKLDVGTCINSVLLAVSFCVIAAVFACRKALIITPAMCMRPKAPKAGKRILMERIDFLWRRFNFSLKMIFRNIFRNKMRLVMCIFGVSMCTAMIVTSLGMQDSMNGMLDMQWKTMFNYDFDVVFKYNANNSQRERIAKLGSIAGAEYQMDVPATLFATNSNVSAITVLEHDSKMVLLEPGVKNAPLSQSGALLNKKLADQIGVKAGEYFYASIAGEKEPLRIKCEKVSDDMIASGAYVTREYWRELNRYFMPQKAHVRLADENQKESIKALVSELDFVDSIIDRDDSMEALEKTMEMMQVEIVIFVLSAGMLAFVVLYNLGLQNMFERMRELATLKVLGFYNSEVKGVVLQENIIFTFIGSIVGVPIGIQMLNYIMGIAGSQIDTLRAIINKESYFYAILLTFVFAIAVNLLLGRRFKSIDMVQSLKSIE